MRRCSPTTARAHSHSFRTTLIQKMRRLVVQNQGQSSLLQTLTSNHPENFLHVSKPQSKASKFYPTQCLFFLLPFASPTFPLPTFTSTHLIFPGFFFQWFEGSCHYFPIYSQFLKRFFSCCSSLLISSR